METYSRTYWWDPPRTSTCSARPLWKVETIDAFLDGTWKATA